MQANDISSLARSARTAMPGSLTRFVLALFARQRSRSSLSLLDEHLLDDIGLNRMMADEEAAKPFWRE